MRFNLEDYHIVSKNLLFLYHACVASEELLYEAENASWGLVDAFGRRLSAYYEAHFEEERGEIAILEADLEQGGIEPGEPDPFSMAIVGTQYYLIKHVHPVALLGYMAVQEADPTPIEVVEFLEKDHGKPLFRFLRVHALKDIEHAKGILALLDEVPEGLQKIVRLSADNVLMHYSAALLSWQTSPASHRESERSSVPAA